MFASVLGGQFVNVTSSDNADNLLNSGIVYRWDGLIPANAPKSYAALITYKTGTNGCVQICFSRTNPQTTYKRVRYDDSTWSEWRVFYDSGLLSNSELLSPLASALGGSRTTQTLTSSDNLDSCTDLSKVYTWTSSSSPSGAPTDYGVMIAENWKGLIVQKCTRQSYVSFGLYYRQKEGSNWSSWRQIYDTSLLTNSDLLSPLASALGGAYNSLSAQNDLNDVLTNGLWLVSSSQSLPAHWPSQEPGCLECKSIGVTYTQIVVTRGDTGGSAAGNGNMYIRKKYNTMSWGSWWKFDVTIQA